MTINATMGIKSIKYGAYAANGTAPQSLTEVSDVYQDSASFGTNDATTTEHKSEPTGKRIVMATQEGHKLTFSIMDPTQAEMQAFMGSDLSGGSIEMKFEVTPVVGKKLTITSAMVTAKINTTYSAKGITLLDVEANTTGTISYADQA